MSWFNGKWSGISDCTNGMGEEIHFDQPKMFEELSIYHLSFSCGIGNGNGIGNGTGIYVGVVVASIC